MALANPDDFCIKHARCRFSDSHWTELEVAPPVASLEEPVEGRWQEIRRADRFPLCARTSVPQPS